MTSMCVSVDTGAGTLDPVEYWLRHGRTEPVRRVAVDAIRDSYSPRVNPVDEQHVALLSQSPTPLCSIIVQRSSMRVVDGVHRLRATVLRGGTHIAVRFFDGADDDAFLLAVRLNVTHGLPLTLAERKAAARRVLETHPMKSDRSIGVIAGLSNKTVATLRRNTINRSAASPTRTGLDGRRRPVRAADGRRRVAEYIATHPTASLRRVARETEVSVATARSVRRSVCRDDAAVMRAEAENACLQNHFENARRLDRQPGVPAEPTAARGNAEAELLSRLQRDPSVRFSERGRRVLRLLSAVELSTRTCETFAPALPTGLAGVIASIARRYAAEWHSVAATFEARSATTPRRAQHDSEAAADD